jgi:Cof subfamily protein (haloacid dehalogenase superfamily)
VNTPPPVADAAAARRPVSRRIRLLISDIDGTLVTPDKTVTPAARAMVDRLRAAGVRFTVVSSRPPRGLLPLVRTLQVNEPFAGFNGGTVARPGGEVLQDLALSPEATRKAFAALTHPGVRIWAYAGGDWLVRDASDPQVAHERHTLGFDPVVVSDFSRLTKIDKLVGVSTDDDALTQAEATARASLAGMATVDRSQIAYLDITHPDANKGHAVRALSAAIGVAIEETAVIGDMTNDISMFDVAGLAVAMGQAAPAVQARADFVTSANTDDGFAHAVERFILPRTEPAAG